MQRPFDDTCRMYLYFLVFTQGCRHMLTAYNIDLIFFLFECDRFCTSRKRLQLGND